MLYKLSQILYKRCFLPFLELVIKITPKYICTMVFLAIGERLGFRDISFRTLLDLGDGHYPLVLTVVPGDRSVIPYVIHKGMWEVEEPRIAFESLKSEKEYILLDIGANLGLFTLQLLAMQEKASRSNLKRVYLVEPDKRLIFALKKNCSQFSGIDFFYIEKAVGAEDGIATFYIDGGNNTNNSLVAKAMEISCEKVIQAEVDVLSGSTFVESLDLPSNFGIIYKSDLQGSDTDVMLSIPEEFWARVDVLIFEVWPRGYDNNPLDVSALWHIMSQFDAIMTDDRVPLTIGRFESLLSDKSIYAYHNVICIRHS